MRVRPFVVAALLVPLLTAAGCKSNVDTKRLLGRWESTSTPKSAPPGFTMTLDFRTTDQLIITYHGAGQSKQISGQYHPLWGDTVVFDHLSESIAGNTVLRDEILLDGDRMTLTDPDGSVVQLRRLP
jgi:hypothetical protein